MTDNTLTQKIEASRKAHQKVAALREEAKAAQRTLSHIQAELDGAEIDFHYAHRELEKALYEESTP